MVTAAAAAIPSGIEGVTPQWLTGVLRAVVDDISAEQIAADSGFSSLLYRVHITGEAGLPASVIVKLPAQSQARGAMEMMGGYAREVGFYQQVAGRAPMGTPQVFLARIADNGVDFVLVLEDLRDWDNADQLTGLSLDGARCCLTQLAGLHAWSARPDNAAVLHAFPSIDSPMTREVFPAVFSAGWQIYAEKTQAVIPASVARYAERFAEHAPAALQALTERAVLVHGDIRADNLFFAGDRMKVVDFQLAARAAGATDVGYLISQGLPTTTRCGRDEELLREYLALLVQRGLRDYSFDDAWRHYRFAVAYLMVLPVIILVSWDSLPDRARRLCVTLADRAVATIDETDALAVFG